MSNQEILKQKFEFFFQERDYKLEDNYCLKTSDSTLPFVNATITPFKDKMVKGEYIENTVHVQDCFRAKFDTSMLFYFQMLGIEAMKSSLEKVMNDIVEALIEVCGIKKEELYIVVNKSDIELIEAWSRISEDSNTIYYLEENIDKYHVRWKYGDTYPLVGNGLTIAYNNMNMEKCSLDCGPFCSCAKYFPMGNVIIIKNTDSGDEYLDVGFGLEAIQAINANGDIFGIDDIEEKVQGILELGYQKETAKKLYSYFSGIKKLCEEGVRIENRGTGYILKKMIRDTYNIMLMFQSGELLAKIDSIFKIMKIDMEKDRSLILDEMRRHSASIEDGKKNVMKYYQRHKSLTKEALFQNLKDTFGLPEFILEKLFEPIYNRIKYNNR